MRNKTLAHELLIRCAGIPYPFRGLIIEAAKRLLQMDPEDETKVREIAEAKSLRWLANMWPLVEDPKDEADKMSTTIHLYCTAAADRIEQMAETIDYARTINAENVRLKAELEKIKQEREKPPATFADQVRRMDDEALAWQFASLFAGGMGGVMEGIGMKFNVEELLTMAYPKMLAELKDPAKEG